MPNASLPLTTLTISGLYVYPLKSAGGIALSCARLDAFGIEDDRRWMLVDGEGVFLSQRTHPRLARIRVALTATELMVSAPRVRSLIVAREASDGARIAVRVWGDTCEGLHVSPLADEWFSRFLSVTCRLVYMPESTIRRVNPAYASDVRRVSFADAFPMLLVGQGSLDDLNRRLATPVPVNRFRPNLVVDGAPPFAEDAWRRLRAGDVELAVVKPCARCSTIMVDQTTGRRGKEPLRTMASYRLRGGEVYFGQNVIHTAPGVLRVGQAVTVTG